MPTTRIFPERAVTGTVVPVSKTTLPMHPGLLVSCMTMIVQVPKSIASMRLPKAVHDRLQALLDKQDSGMTLTSSERKEAEGLVDMAEFLSLLKMRAART